MQQSAIMSGMMTIQLNSGYQAAIFLSHFLLQKSRKRLKTSDTSAKDTHVGEWRYSYTILVVSFTTRPLYLR
jgi:hypothetical protein